MKRILITGGAGFIGSHVVRRFVRKYPDYQIFNIDKLTYAGNLENLKDIEALDNYHFLKGDITDSASVYEMIQSIDPDGIIHLAAESHVDRSITSPLDFVLTNVVGTFNLLNAALNTWKNDLATKRFYHISTDEVFGSLGPEGSFNEHTPYDPHSPYSASKASSDHFVRAYHDTYGLGTVISNCSNNYGPYHFPEKLIPLAIHNISTMKPIPMYGNGENVRDWLYVEDHAAAIDLIFHYGQVGKTFTIGGNNERTNLEVIRLLCQIMDRRLKREPGTSESLITFVTDRAGHDQRYAIDSSTLQRDLGWSPETEFSQGLEKTVDWYLKNGDWLNRVTSGEYVNYYQGQYKER